VERSEGLTLIRMVRAGKFSLDPELRRQLDAVLPPSSSIGGYSDHGAGDETGETRAAGAQEGNGRAREEVPERRKELLDSYLARCLEEDRFRKVECLREMPFEVQEVALAEDLLDTLMGSPGELIRLTPSLDSSGKTVYTFHIDRRCEASAPLCALADQVLEVANDYVRVVQFVESCEDLKSGLILHSIGYAIGQLVREYQVVICQLEESLRSGGLSLQRMIFVIRPISQSMQCLRRVVEAIGTKTGSAAFLALEKRARAEEAGNPILSLLLSRAAAPVLHFSGSWMCRGTIEDPHGEFFLREHADERREFHSADLNNAYWERRYEVKSECVPMFLSDHIKKLLLAGKYINVLRECNVDVDTEKMDLQTFFRENVDLGAPSFEYNLAKSVLSAFEVASSMLVEYFMTDLDLLGRLKSIKRYFFFDHGDYLTHFLDIANEELNKPSTSVSKMKLSSLLELAIRTSSSKNDPYKDCLSCSLSRVSVADQLLRIMSVSGDAAADFNAARTSKDLRAYEAFCIDYNITWPVSLVMSRKAITKYQLIFRHLFHCKFIERSLTSSWRIQQVQQQNTATRNAFIGPGSHCSSSLRHAGPESGRLKNGLFKKLRPVQTDAQLSAELFVLLAGRRH